MSCESRWTWCTASCSSSARRASRSTPTGSTSPTPSSNSTRRTPLPIPVSASNSPESSCTRRSSSGGRDVAPGNLVGHQHVTACVKTRSGGLPQLDPIALGIGDPAEPADTLHFLRFLIHVRSLAAQLRKHRIQVADPEVEHGLLGAGPEVAGPGLERREHRQPGPLTPHAVLIGVQAQAIAIPRTQGRRVGGPHEIPTDPKHTFHAAHLARAATGQAGTTPPSASPVSIAGDS